jgi:hypothetical protein
MRICFDHVLSDDGRKIGELAIHTEMPSVIAMLLDMQANPAKRAQAGWAEISKHPDHARKSRFEVAIVEIVKADDKEARNALGV